MTSAYPDKAVQVISVSYLSDLHLTRKIVAVQRRTGEDADYVLSKCYEATVTLKTADEQNETHFPVSVPAGLLTDLSSVPWWGRWIVSRVGPHLEASIVHDWLYVAWQDEEREPTDPMRRFADDVFLAAMREAGVGSFKRWLIHRAVRWGGNSPFRRTGDRVHDVE